MLRSIRKAKEEGFTLIELLIVIIILGILAAIVVFAVGTTRGDAVNSTCKTDVKSIQLAVEAIKTKTGNYPTAAGSTGGDNILATSTTTGGQVLKAWPGGTVTTAGGKTTSADDVAFVYSGGGGSTYTLTVYGANLANVGNTGAALTQDAADGPVGTSGTVAYACKNS